ncbi:hypothetical protein CBL_08466 [Carabus blaptoides fortunei]
MYAAGTVRMNRFYKPPFMSDKYFKKKKTDYSEDLVSQDGIIMVKWQDNKPVHMASNIFGTGRTDKAKRWDKQQSAYIEIERPDVIREYNKSMGGVGVNNPDKNLALGDKELLLELNKDTIYGDGTFDKVPNMSHQLYTWHAQIGNSYPSSSQKVIVDFRKACMSAVRIVFPHAVVKGCYFHLNQSVIRKIDSVGLKKMFETSVDAKFQLKSLAALSFVPEHDVRKVFDILAATFPDEENYNEVLTYFFSTYIEGAAGRDPQFPIKIWNHYDAALEQTPKTTNCCEGFHNALNSIFH